MTSFQPWSVDDVCRATRGVLASGDPQKVFSGIAIDSRTLAEQNLFVSIVGRRHDGHRFATEALEKGAGGVLIDQDQTAAMPLNRWRQNKIVCITVADTTRALGDLAAFHRRRGRVRVVAVTGSNGKTSTKDMTAAVFAKSGSVLSTEGNLNNEIGLPLTLLRLTPDHRWAILELGMNRPGEIRRLAEVCRPDIGVLTNIGPAHLAGVGSLEGVSRAKAELLAEITPGGTAVLNADDPRVMALAASARSRVFRYGRNPQAAVRASAVSVEPDATAFQLHLPAGMLPIRLAVPGVFMVANALAAAAAAVVAGIVPEHIKAGLEAFRPAGGRLHLFETAGGVHVIDDTYNANPASMAAALETLNTLRGQNRAVCIFGDMYELGEAAATLHAELGASAARTGITKLYASGTFAGDIAGGARKAGMAGEHIFTGSRRDIAADLEKQLQPGDWVLVKGSRASAMETVVAAIARKDSDN